MAKEVQQTEEKAKAVDKAKWKKTAAPKRKHKTKKNQNAIATFPAVEEREERPFMVRVLTVGVASYLAHKVWTKRKMLTEGWHTEEQTETEQGMVTAFEYLSSMGLIFVVGIVVGVIFSKVAKWFKGTAQPAEQQLMAPSGRRRVGRTLRRPRRRSAANSGMSTRSTAGVGPLQAIGENTVVELGTDEALDTDARFGLPVTTLTSPSPKKQSKKKKKKRPRESAAFRSEKKRKQQLETLLDELETQVQEQCDELVADAERRAQELEMELKVQLLFLPEAVRKMPWKTFVEDFGGDLQNVIHSLSQSQTSTQPSPPRTRSSMARHEIVAATPCSIADPEESEYEDEPESGDSDLDHDARTRRLSAFTTPMAQRRTGEAPRSVLRTARKGETTYSVRGSPIVPDTVAKAKAPAGSLVATFEKGLEPTSCCLQLDSDRVLDLSRPEELSAESRGEATSKLKALQAKVAQLLSQINPCSR